MNNSIYKKKIAFKQSLPQYGNGGNFFGKAGAGAMGLISKVPGVSMLTPLMEESKIVKKNKASFDIGQGLGDLGMIIPKALTGDIGGAVSSGLSAGNEFMQGGSEIAKNRGNTERAERLDKAAMGFQAGSQVAGMTSMFTGGAAGGGTGGFNFNSFLGFDPTKLGTKLGGEVPVVMKNGGMIKRADGSYSKRGLWDNIRANAGSGKKPTPEMLEQERKISKKEDGGYTYSTEGANQSSNYNVGNPKDNSTSVFIEPKKKTISEVEKVMKQQQVVQEDGTVTDGLGNIIKTAKERAEGRLEESASPIDLIGSGIYSGGAKMLVKGLDKAGSKLLPKVSFKSEIDWAKWNKEIPANKALMQEYNAIEQQAKASGKWMKNPDGSTFQGSPEQFIQQNSSNFKKSFPNPIRDKFGNIQYNYHGSPNKLDFFDESKAAGVMHGKGIYTTPDKDIALKYAKNNPESKVYELYINSNKPQNKTVIKDFYDFKKKDKELRDLYSKTEDDILKKNIAQEHKKLGDDWGIKYSEDLKNQDLKKEFDYLRVGDNQVTPFSNYPKSAIGNNGMFDMTNPNIYKSILPAATGLGAASQLDKKQNGGLLQYDNGGYTDLIKYDGATHDNSPIDGIPIAANGQQLNSGFSNNIPPATKALVEDGEYYIKDKNYVITNNDKLKPTKDMSFLNPKKTFAKNLNTIKNKYKGRENDPITETSYKREENRLIEANETMRLAKEAKTNPNPLMMAKNGGKLPKYFNGGINNNLLPFTNPIQPSYATTNVFGSGVPKELNTSLNTNQNNIMGVQNPIAPNTGFNQRRAMDAGADFSRTEPFKYEPKSKEGNLFTQPGGIGAMANVPSTIYNIAQGLSPIKKTPAILAKRTTKQGPIKVDYNPLFMSRNAGMGQISQGSTSDSVARANKASLYRGINTQLGELAQKEALTNVGIEQQNEARAMQENAADQRAMQLAQQYDISAEQAKRLAMAEGMKGMGLIAKNVADQQIGFGENEMKYEALQSMFANWKLANPGKTYADFLKSGQAGKITFNNLTA